ncbi:unnamed protein product [Adineta steineri]|uniref:Uncharacterized protein n=1 Tax=Adineta steineri TaxID=433720 RepID=A0A814XVT0_9BILA|nr:unnamed protein product [Adineta steineri]CAF4135818.1 unnamed protein product [Adineta steineri]
MQDQIASTTAPSLSSTSISTSSSTSTSESTTTSSTSTTTSTTTATTTSTTKTTTTSTTTTTTTTTTFIFNSTCSQYYCCTFGPTPCVYNNVSCACVNNSTGGGGTFYCPHCAGLGPSTYYGGGTCYYGGSYFSGC